MYHFGWFSTGRDKAARELLETAYSSLKQGDITARFCIGKFGARQGLPTPTQLAQKYFELYKERL